MVMFTKEALCRVTLRKETFTNEELTKLFKTEGKNVALPDVMF